jgi:hypothetical protein
VPPIIIKRLTKSWQTQCEEGPDDWLTTVRVVASNDVSARGMRHAACCGTCLNLRFSSKLLQIQGSGIREAASVWHECALECLVSGHAMVIACTRQRGKLSELSQYFEAGRGQCSGQWTHEIHTVVTWRGVLYL